MSILDKAAEEAVYSPNSMESLAESWANACSRFYNDFIYKTPDARRELAEHLTDRFMQFAISTENPDPILVIEETDGDEEDDEYA